MGVLAHLRTIAPSRRRADEFANYNQAFLSGASIPPFWMAGLSAAGVTVTPDLAMTLSAYYCGVTTIAYDLATLPLRGFRLRSDGGADLVTASANAHAAGIGNLAYKLQWQPNAVQTATEFWAAMLAQLEMREVGYAEIIPGPSGFMDQLLPRHPDRVTPQRLPSGRLRFKLTETNGETRYVTQDDMFVLRGLSFDGGVTMSSRVLYGANALGIGMAAEKATGRFFKTGMTAALLATYVGEMDDEDEAALHGSISRYAAGVENSFGLMLVPDNVSVKNLAVEPEKAQMMAAREWTVFEVARELRISPRKLMIRGKEGYGSAYQDTIDHVVGCLRPRAVLVQQAVQRDLVLAQDVYRFIFHLGELLKGDPAQMGDFIQKLIASRAMTPSEIRMTYLDLNPNPHLDELSESDNRPGQSATPATQPSAEAASGPGRNATMFRAWLSVRDAAERCIRRELAGIEKLAKRHANNVEAWRSGLREFYADHASFMAETMRLPLAAARGIAAQHGEAFESHGMVLIDGAARQIWEQEAVDTLASVAIDRSAA